MSRTPSDAADALEAALDNRIAAIISQSYGRWRGEQRRVMRDTYQAFCAVREHACREKLDVLCSAAQKNTVPLDLQAAISTWFAEERVALEQSYAQWEQEETKALGEALASWQNERRRALADEQARVLQDQRLEVRRELEAWKDQERQLLLADTRRTSVAAEGELQVLRDELRTAMQLLRAANDRSRAAETERDEHRKRAHRAEISLKAEQALSASRAQSRPDFQSSRGERLAKRVRIENDARLQALSGDLFTKIKKASAAGLISREEADHWHQIRMEGNRAAHEPQGCFGTQVGPGELDPESEPEDSGNDSNACCSYEDDYTY